MGSARVFKQYERYCQKVVDRYTTNTNSINIIYDYNIINICTIVVVYCIFISIMGYDKSCNITNL